MSVYPAKSLVIEIPAYGTDGGLVRPWPADYSIRAVVEYGGVTIEGDKAGLRALAVHLLALSEPDVPAYYHSSGALRGLFAFPAGFDRLRNENGPTIAVADGGGNGAGSVPSCPRGVRRHIHRSRRCGRGRG
ncbi:hypothetical protein GCM10010140_40340 [Streptosporangium pseudovulgare]|uniref:Uncharacterized protein n=1 Tax=Streptosporangium pseudovulgare TaxID=35765 RepID=A0ABQ2QZU3_9ACTN|nr:hypothetical protein GCM10010140_40340 [Streptosporangium pseudovulgare]